MTTFPRYRFQLARLHFHKPFQKNLWKGLDNAYREVAVTNLNRNRGSEKRACETGVGEDIAGSFQWVELQTYPLGMESQRWPVILRWKNGIA
jgi:hypothetical protein